MSEESTEETVTTETTTTEAPAEQGSLLDDKAPTLSDGEWFQSDGIKGSGDAPDWYQAGHFKNVNEQAKGYAELQKKFGSFVGSPKDGYELPEGFDKDDALAQEVIKFGEETNLSQDGFTKLMALANANDGAAQEVNQENELAKLGDNADQRIKAVENALKFKAGDGYGEIQDLITTADGVILAEKLIKTFAPTKLPMDGGENPTGITWADIEVEMFKKDAQGNLLRSTDLNHAAKVKRMQQEWGGNAPDIVTVS